ncbi:MAG: DUF4923 family protein [Prevotella sp.]|nr:DUF4923 family protein [Prevotella sp.]
MMKAILMSMLLMMGMTAQAQDVSDILNSVLGGSSSGDMVSNLTTVFSSKKQATKEKIIGTWAYTEPAIVFTSDNFLAKAGAKIAANKLESKLQEQLTKYGIKPGAFTMTFKEDGTFTETMGGKTKTGKWEVKDSKLQLSVAGVKTLAITTQIDGKDMQFVTDATKLLNLFKTLGAKSSNSQIKTVTTLMKSINGMQAGITMRKQ